jgi:hypothetical protein
MALVEIERARARGKSTHVLRGRSEVSQFLVDLPKALEVGAAETSTSPRNP